MPFPFAAIAGAVLPKLAEGILGRNDEKKAQKRANYQNQVADNIARRRFKADRANDRAYAEGLTKRDRAYAATQRADERRYAASVSAKDRKDFLADKAADAAAYKADRAGQQKLANTLAERQAESRGLDFQQLRDDAVAAGFNPLTALGFAGSYSREVGYAPAGGAYDQRAQAPGSVTAGPGAVIPSQQVASAGFASSGGGYQASSAPVFSSSSFLADALDAGISTYFNSVQEQDDVTYQNIANQVASGQIAREVARSTPRSFGYNLSKVEPYRPSVSYGSPAIRSDGGGVLSSVYPAREVEVAPVTNTPFYGEVDVGYGNTVPAINPDLDVDGPAAWVNGMWLSAAGAASWLDAHDGGLNERLDRKLRAAGKSYKKSQSAGEARRAQLREGRKGAMQSYMRTGTRPVWQPYGK